MASVNKVIIVGNLGRDPETRYMPNGDAVTHIAVATSESWCDKDTGEKREITEWHRVVFYRKLAEIAGEYLKKGAAVYVEGRLQTRKWTDKDRIERYTTEIIANSLQMLGVRAKSASQASDGASDVRIISSVENDATVRADPQPFTTPKSTRARAVKTVKAPPLVTGVPNGGRDWSKQPPPF